MLPLESVPNFSEGRDSRVIAGIGDELARFADLLDIHSDEDHNRSVFTLVGDDAAIVDALLAAIAYAMERIDLRKHEGVHPRIGAADVVPVVAVRPDDRERARDAALVLAQRVGGARAAGVPVRRARRGTRARILPARRAGGAAAQDRLRRARTRLRAVQAAPVRRR